MTIIDIHTHIYPTEVAQKATDSIRDFYEIHEGAMDGSVKMLLERSKQAGISRSVILPVAITANRVQKINDFIHRQAEENPCFIPFGTVHADMEDIAGETERLLQMGMRGIKLHPDCSRFAIDDERLFPMYEAIRGKIPILFHMGDKRYGYSHPEKLRHILELFPGLTTIAAHFGGYTMYETACEILKDTDCFMDISSSLMFMGEGIAEHYINLYGAERLAYGTDYPLWDPVEEVNRFRSLKLSPTQFDQIAHKTAENLFGL